MSGCEVSKNVHDDGNKKHNELLAGMSELESWDRHFPMTNRQRYMNAILLSMFFLFCFCSFFFKCEEGWNSEVLQTGNMGLVYLSAKYAVTAYFDPMRQKRKSQVWLHRFQFGVLLSSSFSRSDFEPHDASTELPRIWFKSTVCFKKHTPTILCYTMIFSFQAKRAIEVASEKLPHPPR